MRYNQSTISSNPKMDIVNSAKQYGADSNLPSFRDSSEIEEIKVQILDKIKATEVYLGSYDRDWNEPYTIPYSPHRRVFLLFGKAGWGKTQWAKSIVFDNYYRRFKENILAVDIKPDLPNLHIPLNQPDLIKILATKGITPTGYRAKRVYIKYTNLLGAKGEGITLSIDNYRSMMDNDTQALAISEILAKDDTPALVYSGVTRVIKNGLPKNFSELGKQLRIEWAKECEEYTHGRPSNKHIRILDYRMMVGQIYDGHGFDWAKSLCENGIIVFQLPKNPERLYMASMYLKTALQNLIDDRELYRRTAGNQGFMSRGFLAYIEELPLMAPKEGSRPSKMCIQQIPTTGRNIGISMVGVAQSPGQIDDKIIENADGLFFGGITSTSVRKVLITRGYDMGLVDEIIRRQPKASNTKIKPWLATFPDNLEQTDIIYPFPCCSEPFKEEDVYT